ncbi:MAG TPA: hypothetical protein VFO25_08130 [Candidatus Eremiobacteraceae bacterium]|nr:hypothetical protein [Candidatus Eremiobacteraceae bacterium]
MAIRLYTEDPGELLDAINDAIDEGHIETWDRDDDGDFTHSADQWDEDAWLRPTVEDEALLLNILAPVGVHLSKEVYGIYHGRFIEMALVHFDEMIGDAIATAMPDDGDAIQG